MPSITLHTSALEPTNNGTTPSNPLPQLLQTPSGLAIVELQGTIHAPYPDVATSSPSQTPIGRIEFPLYDPTLPADSTAWMKKVYLYVGLHQRMTGEVKKLPKPLAVVARRDASSTNDPSAMDVDAATELEIRDIVRYKVVFSSRPEPVSQDV